MGSPVAGRTSTAADDRNGSSLRKTLRRSISRASVRKSGVPPPPVPDLPPTLTLPLDIDPSAPPTAATATTSTPNGLPHPFLNSPSQSQAQSQPRRPKLGTHTFSSNSGNNTRVPTGLTAPASGASNNNNNSGSNNGASPAAALALSASASFAESDRRYLARQAVEEITNVRLSPHHANTLLTLCATEIKNRGLETPGIFRPMRLAESHKELDALIRLFLLSVDSERFAPLFGRNGGALAAQSYASSASASVVAAIAPVGSGAAVGLAAGSCLNAPGEVDPLGLDSKTSSLLPSKQSDLLHLFDEKLDAASAQAHLHERIQHVSVLDVVAFFKWGLRHLKLAPADFGITSLGADPLSWYETFRRDESAANYPLNAYSKFLVPRLQVHTKRLLATVFEVMSSVSAHHLSNFMPACTLVRVLGFWLLGRIGSDHPPPNLTGITTSWSRASILTEHLFLAYLRDQVAHSLYELPLRLTELVDGYPNLAQFREGDAVIRDEFLSDAERVSRKTPQLPPTLRSRRVVAIKATLRSENIMVSLKRPRTPSDTLAAALGAETCDAEEDELVAWDIIQRAAARAAGGRDREMSNASGGLVSAHRMSMSQSAVNLGSPTGDSTVEQAPADPAVAAAETHQRKRETDAKREAAVLDEEHSRIFNLVAGAIAVRRAVIEAIDPREAAAAAAAAMPTSYGASQQQQRSMTSPVYGSVYNRYGGRNGNPYSQSTSEFATFSTGSAGRSSISQSSMRSPMGSQGPARGPTSTPGDLVRELRKSTSFSGKPSTHTRESSLTPLPEDVDMSGKTTPLGPAALVTEKGQAQANGSAKGTSAISDSPSSILGSDWASFASGGFGASSSNAELTLKSPTPFLDKELSSPTEELEEMLTPDSKSRIRRASSSYNSMRRNSRRAMLNAAAINGEYSSPNGAGSAADGSTPGTGGGNGPVPGPTHKLVALETIEIDETLSAAWQDQLLDFSLCAHFPPLVLAALNSSLISTVHAALPDDALALSWILIDETVIPPRPPLPASASGDRGESASISDKRSLFAPSIRSLATSLRKLRGVGSFLSKRPKTEKSSADAMMS
ncbi:unnamed protein product [Tilletia laevis]|uniref:Meiotically up-regulated protein Msb1/Mug8 domain-containing protein n=2 Tax=Tilletia TaxID=13289 RepID=A0A177VJ36_9BASI|nr:hypothetical protein CF336_g306 [Tilletia laevis]KAE8265294.1 hypothetical protein A4X03_0g349 [Tilletia caries]KAE8208807.1 hypothetical protein CF335_g130 [Tilletia laevis]CAD6890727.1 unnamed protein product [Tilletia caries]CAD6909627.1 unnamed protein product [Tilletia laevis]